MTDLTPPTTLLLVRHAEVDNPERVLYGRLPRFGLSPLGLQQAALVGDFLATQPIAAIYSSPLLRARQTANAIARHHPTATLHRNALLLEVGTAWQGTPFAELPPGFRAVAHRRGGDDESVEDIRQRMLRFVAQIRSRHPGETVAAVSHGDPITILRLALQDKPLTVPSLSGPDYASLASVTAITLPPNGARPDLEVLPVPGVIPAPPRA